MAESEDNPFRVPPDDQIFSLREQERLRRAEERENVKHLKVWEKTTASSTIRRARRIQDGTDEPHSEAMTKTSRSARTESLGRDPRREKENVSEFVAKKREMFLVQMSLDVKKAEILKLDIKAKQKEEALKKSQIMLDEDVTRFDAFLQSNDQKAHKAMKDAEDLTKKKQDKLQRIKSLKSQLSAVQSEIGKHKEQKDECEKYKTFLIKLTPPEWKEQKMQEKLERKKARKRRQVDEKMAQYAKKMQEEIEQEELAFQERTKPEKPKARSEEAKEAREREKEMEMRRRRIRKKYPTREAVEADVQDISSGEEMPLYFKEPRQLLEIFTALEESNLFLIQNSQDTEQAWEVLDHKFSEMKRSSYSKTAKMKQNIAMLEKQIAEEKARCDELRRMLGQKRGGSEPHKLLQEVAENIHEVFAVCGHASSSDHDGDTEKMLRAIEAKLEDFLTALDEFEEGGFRDKVSELEKSKDKERREIGRKMRIEMAEHKIEERLKKSLQRSQTPIHKKVGKQIMFRSAPLFQARRIVMEDTGFDEAMKEHEIFGVWIGRDGIPNATPPQKSQ